MGKQLAQGFAQMKQSLLQFPKYYYFWLLHVELINKKNSFNFTMKSFGTTIQKEGQITAQNIEYENPKVIKGIIGSNVINIM